MRKWHPDTAEDTKQAKEISTQINRAYEIVMDYVKNYAYDFSEEALQRAGQTPDEWWQSRFGEG